MVIFAAMSISLRNRSGPSAMASSGLSTLIATLAAELLYVFGKVNRRHPSATKLSLEVVTSGEARPEVL